MPFKIFILQGYNIRDKALEKFCQFISKTKTLANISFDIDDQPNISEESYEILEKSFMKNQSIVQLQTDIVIDECSEKAKKFYQSLQIIVQANYYMQNNKDVVKELIDNAKNPIERQNIPIELEQTVR